MIDNNNEEIKVGLSAPASDANFPDVLNVLIDAVLRKSKEPEFDGITAIELGVKVKRRAPKHIKFAAATYNANGEPDFFFGQTTGKFLIAGAIDDDQYEEVLRDVSNQLHDNGYESTNICYTEYDVAFQYLRNLFNWDQLCAQK